MKENEEKDDKSMDERERERYLNKEMTWEEQVEYEEKHGRKGYDYYNMMNRADKLKNKAAFQME